MLHTTLRVSDVSPPVGVLWHGMLSQFTLTLSVLLMLPDSLFWPSW
jgi:hypothetical protein